MLSIREEFLRKVCIRTYKTISVSVSPCACLTTFPLLDKLRLLPYHPATRLSVMNYMTMYMYSCFAHREKRWGRFRQHFGSTAAAMCLVPDCFSNAALHKSEHAKQLYFCIKEWTGIKVRKPKSQKRSWLTQLLRLSRKSRQPDLFAR